MLAKVYRMRLETPDDPPGPWCWYWTDTDETVEESGDASDPFASADDAAKDARRNGYEVVRRT